MWKYFKLSIKRLFRLKIDEKTVKAENHYTESSLISFMNRQTNVELVYFTLYGLNEYFQAYDDYLQTRDQKGFYSKTISGIISYYKGFREDCQEENMIINDHTNRKRCCSRRSNHEIKSIKIRKIQYENK